MRQWSGEPRSLNYSLGDANRSALRVAQTEAYKGRCCYLINDALPELIKAGKTPTLRLLGSDGRDLA